MIDQLSFDLISDVEHWVNPGQIFEHHHVFVISVYGVSMCRSVRGDERPVLTSLRMS